MNDLHKAVRLTLFISGSFATIVIVAYVVAQGWNDSAMWGAFGDFVGGILNPIFAFANVVVLVVISYQLAEMEDDRAEKDRRAQDESNKFGMRFAASNELHRFHLDLQNAVSTVDAEQIYELRSKLFGMMQSYKLIFPSLKELQVIDMLETYHHLYTSASIYETIKTMDPRIGDIDEYRKNRDLKFEEYKLYIPRAYEIVNDIQIAMTKDLIN
ncbi:putative membrane protein [Dyadobacter sp. BE34]|nr:MULTISPECIES: hypothetical protein [Dyadobacter]MDR7047537.1 putative membrane protein [Dyadobacter sp. BE242]MDR7201707.1 putative membrane protein [Dyadobacter sp. BE34]MDR7219577.1 putative membrane protein [Dyadobacter sp. BE31]MDR7267300.1 putative membrane protein [Dyadobacter sp. BE32]